MDPYKLLDAYNNSPQFRRILNSRVNQRRIMGLDHALKVKYKITIPSKDFAKAVGKPSKGVSGTIKKRVSHMKALAVMGETEKLIKLVTSGKSGSDIWLRGDFPDRGDVLKILYEYDSLKDLFEPQLWAGKSDKMASFYKGLPDTYRIPLDAELGLPYITERLRLYEVSKLGTRPNIKRRRKNKGQHPL